MDLCLLSYKNKSLPRLSGKDLFQQVRLDTSLHLGRKLSQLELVQAAPTVFSEESFQIRTYTKNEM
jgi:hypothetical protein